MSSRSEDIPVVWSEEHRRHDPCGEVWVGVRTPGSEVAERAERIHRTLVAAGLTILPCELRPEEDLTAVHDRQLIDYLAHAWEDWQVAGLDREPGQDRVVPYLFPHPGLVARPFGDRDGPGAPEMPVPAAVSARAGRFTFDTMSLIGPGTWEAARAAAGVALTAADLVAGGLENHEAPPVAYALTRPPGHHACRSVFGGSCYLNNGALAAARLRESTGGPVAIIDIDAHHGNGAQQIFYDDPAVLTGSTHVDPGAGWFPHFVGFAAETGTGEGEGANRNFPLAPGAGDKPWLRALEDLTAWALGRGASSLVLALGVDSAASDPESPLEVTAEGYRRAGALIGDAGLPTVITQEGGYDLTTIGPLVLATLEGITAGSGP